MPLRLSYDECAGVTYDELHRDPDAALDRIVERYHLVAEKCDAVVVVGSDYTDVGAPTEFSFNARVAANLGAPVLLVRQRARARPRGAAHHRPSWRSAELRGPPRHPVRGRRQPRRRGDSRRGRSTRSPVAGVPAFALPDEPLLSAPSVGRPDAGLRAAGWSAARIGCSRGRPTGLVVAAMTLPNVLDRLFDGAVVVTPGDRPEVVLGVLIAHVSADFPQIVRRSSSTAASRWPPQVGRLIDGLRRHACRSSRPTSAPRPPRPRSTPSAGGCTRTRRARSRPRSRCSTSTSTATPCSTGSRSRARDAVTPLMFEHQLIDRAVADRRHIVLPEGEEDRILRAADILLRRGVADLTLLGDPRADPARGRRCSASTSQARSCVEPARRASCASGSPRSTTSGAAHKGVDLERRARRRARRVLLRHDDGRARAGRRHGLRRGAHHRAHDPAGARGRQDGARRLGRLVGVLHVPAPTRCWSTATARSTPTRPPSSSPTSRSPRPRTRSGVRGRAAGRDAVLLDRRLRLRHRRREGRPRPPRWCASARRTCPVEGPIQYDAAVDAAVARTKLPGLPGRRPRDGVRLPRPQHRQQHLQGGAALGRRASPSARSSRACASRSTTCPAARPCATSSTPSRSRRSRPRRVSP